MLNLLSTYKARALEAIFTSTFNRKSSRQLLYLLSLSFSSINRGTAYFWMTDNSPRSIEKFQESVSCWLKFRKPLKKSTIKALLQEALPFWNLGRAFMHSAHENFPSRPLVNCHLAFLCSYHQMSVQIDPLFNHNPDYNTIFRNNL